MSRGAHRLIGIMFIAGLCLAGALDLLWRLAGWIPPGRAYRDRWPPVTVESLVHGEAAGDIETALVQGSAFVNGPGAIYNEVLWALLGRTGERIRIGRDGWIFLREQVAALPSPELARRIESVPAAFVAAARRLREATGARILVVLQPNRSRLYADTLPQVRPDPGRDRLRDAVVGALRGAGIEVLDLAPVFERQRRDGGQPFYRDDHHWTWRGAETAARAVAATLTRDGWTPGVTAAQAAPAWVADPERHRSLLQFLRFRRGSAAELPFIDEQPRAVFSWRADERASAPVVVLATSNGLYGFAEFLGVALQAPVAARVAPGKGALFPAHWLLAQSADGRDGVPPEVIVWEVPEYHLAARDELDVELPARAPGAPAVLVRVDGRDLADAAASFRTTRHVTRLVAALERPAARAELWLSVGRFGGVGRLRPVGAARTGDLLVIDGRGPVRYVVELERPALEVQLELDLPVVDVAVQGGPSP